jgi:putative ABC transport system ATP-binding protein
MIRLEKVCRDFQVGDQVVHALDHIDLDIKPGDYISIMGPSGSGKSTLLNILGLLDRPNSGTYWLNDADVSSLDDDALAEQRQKNIGFIFQSFHLIARLSALENVELPLLLAGAPVAARRERAREVLDSVGLAPRADHRPEQLSGGERQRVAIGRAIVMKPGLLLADEPTGNLDSRSSEEVIDLVEQLNRGGISLMVVTHDIDIGRRARRHISLRDGKVINDEDTRSQ